MGSRNKPRLATAVQATILRTRAFIAGTPHQAPHRRALPCRPGWSVIRTVRSSTCRLSRPPCTLAFSKGDTWLLDKPCTEQDAVARHTHDVTFEAAEIGQEYVNGLLLAGRPALRHPLIQNATSCFVRGRAPSLGRFGLAQTRTR